MENKGFSDVLSSVENGIQKIIFNRPKRKNAITPQMYLRIVEILNESAQNVNVHMVVFTGMGEYFSSGNDFATTGMERDENTSPIMAFKQFVDALITYPKLLVTVVNGPAIGIAVTMLPLCDMVYAADIATFQTPFSKYGLTAEGCSTYTFPKIMGNSKAGDMLYLSSTMNAQEAKQCGFISEIYPLDRLEDIWTYLKAVSSLSMESIIATKRLMKRWEKDTLLKVNEEEVNTLSKQIDSSDTMERLLSFMTRKSKL